MEIDRELIEDCVEDMEATHKCLLEMSRDFGIPVFIPAMMLNLRIIDLKEELKC